MVQKKEKDVVVEEKKSTVSLEFIGKSYHGVDAGFKPHVHIEVKTGDVVDVSEVKADQLLSDFPKEWKKSK